MVYNVPLASRVHFDVKHKNMKHIHAVWLALQTQDHKC